MNSNYVLRGLIAIFALCAGIGAVHAQEQPAAPAPAPSSVETTLGGAYLGKWVLQMEFNGNPVEMTLVISGKNGKLAGEISSEMQPEPTAINDFSMLDDGGLSMTWPADFNGQALTMNIKAKLTDEGIAGVLSEKSGMFSAEFTAAKEGGASGGGSSADGVASDGDGDGNRGRRGRGMGEAKVTIAEKEIRALCPPLKSDTPEYQSLDTLADGAVFGYTTGRAIKFQTHGDLAFGDTIVKTANHVENYPGTYSVWLKRSGDGWKLVFNSDSDIWGSQRLAEADVAEVPLVASVPDAPSETFQAALDAKDSGGTLTIRWGTHQWSADFAVK